MMLANVSNRLSSFGDYTNLSYNKDDIISILGIFDEPTFAPAAIQEINPIGHVSQRMQFATQDGRFLIAINSDRIDIFVTSEKKAGFSQHEKTLAKDKAVSSMKKILTYFGDRVAEPFRLAWNPTFVYFELTDEERQQFRCKFRKDIEFFKGNELQDYLTRYGARKEYSIGEKKEKINILATIENVSMNKGLDDEVNGFKIDYDINTWQENRKARFSLEDVAQFVDTAVAIQKQLDEVILP